MESIYWVVSWVCHRRCMHCYDDRFHPYAGAELEAQVATAVGARDLFVSRLPARMTFLDTNRTQADGGFVECPGSIVLAGGEILLDPVRERVLYPLLTALHERYQPAGGVRLIVQTTGDLVTEQIVDELLERNVWMISVSGIDPYHSGLENGSARAALQERLTRLFVSRGLRPHAPPVEDGRNPQGYGRCFQFFGATPDSWIGTLWPRGRAMANGLTTSTLADNFCNRWSGGLNFLARRHAGSEVSIDPEGNVYPCCLKTRAPIGNLRDTALDDILDALVGNPVYEAISMGHPERMGISHGWSVDRFLEESRIGLPYGRTYRNLCIGCDRFHDQVLVPLGARVRRTG